MTDTRVPATPGQYGAPVGKSGDPSAPTPEQEAKALFEEQRDIGSKKLLMKLFIASLAMLFAGTMVAYIVTALQQPIWPPPNSPAIPFVSLTIGTVVIVFSSASLIWGILRIRSGDPEGLTLGMWLTLAFAILFMIVQTINWFELGAAHASVREWTLFTFLFYVLTVLHALHVVGGLVSLVQVLRGSIQRIYTRENHVGVVLFAWYWHFLDIVW